jgi:hypothetical protein
MSESSQRDTPIASAILLASAFLIAALTIVQAGRLQANKAFAGDAVTGLEGYTLLTASSGFGKDTRPYEFCYVIDNHDEMLFIFEIPQANDKRVILKSGTSLPGLFAAARGANTP